MMTHHSCHQPNGEATALSFEISTEFGGQFQLILLTATQDRNVATTAAILRCTEKEQAAVGTLTPNPVKIPCTRQDTGRVEKENGHPINTF